MRENLILGGRVGGKACEREGVGSESVCEWAGDGEEGVAAVGGSDIGAAAGPEVRVHGAWGRAPAHKAREDASSLLLAQEGVSELEREAALPLGVRVRGAAVKAAVHDALANVLAHLAAHAQGDRLR